MKVQILCESKDNAEPENHSESAYTHAHRILAFSPVFFSILRHVGKWDDILHCLKQLLIISDINWIGITDWITALGGFAGTAYGIVQAVYPALALPAIPVVGQVFLLCDAGWANSTTCRIRTRLRRW